MVSVIEGWTSTRVVSVAWSVPVVSSFADDTLAVLDKSCSVPGDVTEIMIAGAEELAAIDERVHVIEEEPEHVHPVPDAEPDIPPGSVSDTVTDEADCAELLVTTSVYVNDVFVDTGSTESDFVIDRSATGVTVSVSEALLLPGVPSVVPAGAATVAEFTTVPEVAVTLAVTVNSKNWPEARAGSVAPAPWSWAIVGAVEHWPGVAEQAVELLDRPVAVGSVTTAPVTELGPLFVTRIV